jgi:putative PIN family toxin of toxin-antitoxin system
VLRFLRSVRQEGFSTSHSPNSNPSTVEVVELANKLNDEKIAKWVDTTQRPALLAFVLREAELVHPVETVAMLRDPDDDKFVALAMAARAFAIITGDKTFLAVGRIRDIDVLTPADFLARYGKS